ncbi:MULTISPECIES: hypothetical protein [unclassified Phyllobacterium]|uniref:hypothetical protein n=1 Tax=unclassified Phyllobacterium TaxID=2638441 RepID=UPI003012F0EA
MTLIIETTVDRTDKNGQYVVEFLKVDGNRVSVLVEQADEPNHDQIIAKANQLLVQSSQSATAAQSQTAAIAHPEQPKGPIAAPNPLLEDYEPDGEIIQVEGEGMIEPLNEQNRN